MNEEEIIKICNKLAADYKHFQEIREKDKELSIYQWNSYDDTFKEYGQAIEGIIDLYNKEKEKNEELEEEIKKERYENLKLDIKIREIKQVFKEIMEV